MKKKHHINTRVEKRKFKKKRKNKKLILFIVIPILLLVTVTSVYAINILNKAQNAVDNAFEDDGRDRSDLREFDVNPNHDHVSVLFIGVDENEHRGNQGSARSDALVLATLNKDDNSVKLLSIPRDSYVYIPEVGYMDKITHAHAFGGALATIESIEGFLDIPVDYWVRLNFHAFVDVVDALGGITIDVPFEFSESNSQDKRDSIHLYPGIQVIDGEEALALARTRKMDNDIERGKRQQEIMKAILDKAISIGSINRFDDVIEAVGDNMGTNLSFNDIISFISYGISGQLQVETLNLEGNDLYLDNANGVPVYYYELNQEHLAEIKHILRSHLGLSTAATNEYEEQSTPETNY
ncbi:LCP family protein [Amphibacillus sediminis]|uniref:LCP family protein n=1 Tax=Amphibacillus sediminis TaxID=360185 RepID=UPI00082AA55F|nr:LCP family protein [Amphibacillus sediminis]